MDVDESFENEGPMNKCFICREDFNSKGELKKHRKDEHSMNVQTCDKFLTNDCGRSEEEYWYNHKTQEKNLRPKSKPVSQNNQVFQKAPQNPLPPDQFQNMMEVMKNLCSKVEKMEERFKDLMN